MEIYHRGEPEDLGSGMPAYDTSSTVAGQSELAPGSLESLGRQRMGFTR